MSFFQISKSEISCEYKKKSYKIKLFMQAISFKFAHSWLLTDSSIAILCITDNNINYSFIEDAMQFINPIHLILKNKLNNKQLYFYYINIFSNTYKSMEKKINDIFFLFFLKSGQQSDH